MADSNNHSLGEPALTDVTIDDDFWQPRRDTNRDVTIDHQYEQLEEGGALDNFRNAAAGGGEFSGMWFEDSDAYKWLEAASYAQTTDPTEEREDRLDHVISLIAEAQEDDGYLNTYFQLEEPDQKWTNLAMMHELYCAGHLIEAATAHYRATGKTSLLDIATDFADHIDDVFGPDGRDGTPGHEEIELALVDLYRVTGEERYLELAEFFVDRRGQEDGRLRWELDHLDVIAGSEDIDEGTRSVFLDDDGSYDGRYAQDHRPLREQEKTEGHSVRAMYLYSSAADLLLEGAGDREIMDSLERLWTNMTEKRMYVTGGIGPEHDHEGFTEDYDLPNETAYAETCAAVGSVMWNQRMARLTGDSRFADVLELALYNGFLAGVSLDGTEFFYVNPLESTGDHHRKGWFECACCPPNVARLLASLEQYVYMTADDAVYVNLYVGSQLDDELAGESVELTQRTDYPWDGDVTIEVTTDESAEFAVNLRIPAWCDDPSLSVAGESVDVHADDGYVTVRRTWEDGDTISLSLPMETEALTAHPAVEADEGKVALRRGPLVYCVEETDVDRPVNHLRLDDVHVEATFEGDLLDGVTTLSGSAIAPDMDDWKGKLYLTAGESESEPANLEAIPYYAWDNREDGTMRVWLNAETTL